ncbi:Agamous-like MADS-box protein AGL80 [Quillaja saponaria]|uniref:Agamous-like MADS-box protein AGL80 n=1 Tax=Quillaja saponaria TaxID=32244 RepID=A0AAD7PYS2_QUISA|nr:Agamous-like MADS-box protein AGL80 [Quillaja saponaria]
MTRKKIKLAWIERRSERKASFQKRNQSLLKKVTELTTLCGVDAFIIIYGPGLDNEQLKIWPSEEKTLELLVKYQDAPELERFKKKVNQESYLAEQMTKLKEKLRNKWEKNNEMNMKNLIHSIVNYNRPVIEFPKPDITNLMWFLQEKALESKRRAICLKNDPEDPMIESHIIDQVLRLDEMGQPQMNAMADGDKVRINPIIPCTLKGQLFRSPNQIPQIPEIVALVVGGISARVFNEGSASGGNGVSDIGLRTYGALVRGISVRDVGYFGENVSGTNVELENMSNNGILNTGFPNYTNFGSICGSTDMGQGLYPHSKMSEGLGSGAPLGGNDNELGYGDIRGCNIENKIMLGLDQGNCTTNKDFDVQGDVGGFLQENLKLGHVNNGLIMPTQGFFVGSGNFANESEIGLPHNFIHKSSGDNDV